MSVYLICIYFLIGILVSIIVFFVCVSIMNYRNNKKITIENLNQKKSALYIKYDLKELKIIINNYTYLNLDVSKSIVKVSKNEGFHEKVLFLLENEDEKFNCIEEKDNVIFNFWFSFREVVDDCVILRCDYNIEKKCEKVELMSLEEIKKICEANDKQNGTIYYLNIKDFNSLNQRYGQECGDYILTVIKKRLVKLDKKNLYCSYLGSDQFLIYYDKSINKKKALKLITNINKKLSKEIDIGYVNIDLVFGVGVCNGNYNGFDELFKGAYIAADYARKRREYNVVIYNESMKLEENIIGICEQELNDILDKEELNISYNPVFYHSKSKFIGYISNIEFSNKLISFNKMKNVAIQQDKIDQFMSVVIDNQLVNYMKKRPYKSSKLFINLKLEDLSTFLEVYLSNPAYSDCKIVICLDIRRGYEMINKFSNISGNISKIIEEGVEFALEINYSNMYEYDYILKNANYLIMDNSIVANMNNALVKNKTINIIDLAKEYELDLIAIDVKEYLQYESLLKYNVNYFSGPYFGKGAKRPNDIEQSKTRIFAKFMKDSKKNKNN